MDPKALNFVILRIVRLILLIISIALIASGAGIWVATNRSWREVRWYYDFSVSEWKYWRYLPGQWFPLGTSLLVFLITVGLLAIFASRRNLQGQYKREIFVVNLSCALTLFLATCLECWYAAGGSVTSWDRVHHGVLGDWFKVTRVDGWIAAVVFMLLTLIDLGIDAVFTRRG